MNRLALFGFACISLACAQNLRTAPVPGRSLTSVQLYLFNRSGETADLKVALDDSVMYYAQVRSAATPSEISGGRLVQRRAGNYRVVLNDFTHAQQISRDVPVAESTVYIVVTTRESGSDVTVSTTRPF
jgi:hypothetical protein